LFLILLSGDIQSNPGPVSLVSSLNMCTLNIRSFTNPLQYTAIADLADTHNIDVYALSETWISPNTTSAQLIDAIPRGFTFINTPRPVPDSYTSSIVGGGTAFLLREPGKLLSYVLVWHFFYCSLLDQILFTIPFFPCQY